MLNKKGNLKSGFLSISCGSTGTQALVRPGSPHSSISADERTTYATSSCLAKALVDSLPNPYDKEALRFKVNITNSLLIKTTLHYNSPLLITSRKATSSR